MKLTKAPFPWDSMIRIFGPKISSKLQLLLQKPVLIESDIRGQLQQYSGLPDAPPHRRPGYLNQENNLMEYRKVNVSISPAPPSTSDILRSNRLKDELYA